MTLRGALVRRLPPRVRGAVGLTILLGLGLVLVQAWEARRHRQAVAVLRHQGAWIFYNCRYDATGALQSARPPGPEWLQAVFGADFLGTVRGVKLTEVEHLEGLGTLEFLGRPCPNVTDATLAPLQDLDGVEWLALHRAAITDAGLEHIRSQARLQRLWLDQTRVTDRGLAVLADLPGLTTLSLRGTAITDAGLRRLAPLVRLERLYVDHTECTLSGIVHLLATLQHRDLRQALEVAGLARRDEQGEVIALDLSRIRAADADLAWIRRLGHLQWLHLNGTQVTDAGLAHLRPLARLELLHLANTRVTDAGLAHLTRLGSLRTLHLEGTQVSEEGANRLRAALPGTLRVYR